MFTISLFLFFHFFTSVKLHKSCRCPWTGSNKPLTISAGLIAFSFHFWKPFIIFLMLVAPSCASENDWKKKYGNNCLFACLKRFAMGGPMRFRDVLKQCHGLLRPSGTFCASCCDRRSISDELNRLQP